MGRFRGWRDATPTPRHLISIVGVVVAASAFAMIPAAVVSLLYSEWGTALGIAVAALITGGAGVAGAVWAGEASELTPKEAFAAVGFAWIAVTLFGTLPFLITGTIADFTNAFFETAAGFTTTGATVVADPSDLPHGILIWRALTQWLGGMGIIVLSIAILPLVGAGGVQLARAESPGPEPDRLTPRFRDTAIRLWLLYVALTAAAVVLLALGDMGLFQSFAHALTTVSTGGFSTEATSLTEFSGYTKWVTMAFMFVAAASFALHIRALRDPKVYLRSTEFRYYVAIISGAALLMIFGAWAGTGALIGTVRDGLFTSLTVVTSTGFIVADYTEWQVTLSIFVVGLMFIGGMAGSTAAALKTYRVGVLASAATAELRRLNRPNSVLVTRFGGDPVPEPLVRSIQSFFLFYVGFFFIGAVLFSFLEWTMSDGTDMISATSAAASTLGNFGPALGEFGPRNNYLGVVWSAKWVLVFLMFLGRLEIFPILLLFTKRFWKR
jgi:trk system potassium uptake protein TrkH